jgi:hypothetical protein
MTGFGRKSLHCAILSTLILAASGAARAQSPATAPAIKAPAPIPADELARRVAPIVDDEAFLVAHADLSAIDPRAAADSLLSLLPEGAPKSSIQEVRGFSEKFLPLASQWHKDFLRAGGRDAYLVLSMRNVPMSWGMLAIPLGDKADANALKGLFLTGRPQAPASRPEMMETCAVAGGMLLIGSPRMIEASTAALEGNSPPRARKELQAAFRSCADAQVQALFLPSRDIRRGLEELLPELPKEVGAGPVTAFTRGVLWASAGINISPRPGVKAMAQSEDANYAAAMAALASKALKAASEDGELKRLFAGPSDLMPLLTPKAQGDRVVLDLSDKDLARLLLAVAQAALPPSQPASQPASAKQPGS